jgi:hypothetical protein
VEVNITGDQELQYTCTFFCYKRSLKLCDGVLLADTLLNGGHFP